MLLLTSEHLTLTGSCFYLLEDSHQRYTIGSQTLLLTGVQNFYTEIHKKSFGTFILHIFTSSVDVSLKEKMFCLHKINVTSFSIRHWVLWNEPWTIHSILKNHSEMFVTGSLLEDDSFIQLLFTTFTASRKFLLNQNYTYSQSVICMGAPHH